MGRVCAVLCLLVVGASAAANRSEVQNYLQTVYPMATASQWNAFSDDGLFAFYNNLTFYYPGGPQDHPPGWDVLYPNGRTESHPYAGTVCNCLHIQLADCKTFNPQATCNYWPVTSYINMHWVDRTLEGIPSYSWFEGLTFPGEWGFPLSCQDTSLMYQVYAFHNHIWLYPITGFGVWWNAGKTAAAPNKVAWLLKYGIGQQNLGSTELEVMDTLAETVCPNFRNRTNINCDYCPYSQTGSNKCCCHGSGYNLGTQVLAVSSYQGISVDQALLRVAGYYKTGMYGQDDAWMAYPVGTFFCYRDLLDKFFIAIQKKLRFDSVQFTREPQHSGGSGTPSSPGYAFELLMQKHSWYYSWHHFCKSNDIGLINPLDHSSYPGQIYIPGSAVHSTGSIQKFHPTPEFKALINLTTPTSLEAHHLDITADDVDSADHNSKLVITLGVTACVALVVVVAAVILRHRRRGNPLRMVQLTEHLSTAPPSE